MGNYKNKFYLELKQKIIYCDLCNLAIPFDTHTQLNDTC